MSDSLPAPQPASAPDPLRLAAALAWAVLVLGGGGFAAGWAVDGFGELGLLSVWLLGVAGGFVAAKILVRKSKPVGWLLVVACCGAALLAEVCWLVWNPHVGQEPGWWGAVLFLPKFIRGYRVAVLVAVVCAVLGSVAAYRQVAVRVQS